MKRAAILLIAETKSTGRFGSREENFLAPFMIHELLPNLTETASVSHPCCVVSFTAVTRVQIPSRTPNLFKSLRGAALLAQAQKGTTPSSISGPVCLIASVFRHPELFL
jgi:hypothetical protein